MSRVHQVETETSCHTRFQQSQREIGGVTMPRRACGHLSLPLEQVFEHYRRRVSLEKNRPGDLLNRPLVVSANITGGSSTTIAAIQNGY